MEILSPAFQTGQKIPSKYTCDGQNINPPLIFKDVPQNTESLVLISDDPDAPMGDWVHWLVWNIDPTVTGIEEDSIPLNAIQGKTDFGTNKYGGPCPPSGEHRYFFKLYALDTKLNIPESSNKSELETAMQDHILASAEMMGTYSRKN